MCGANRGLILMFGLHSKQRCVHLSVFTVNVHVHAYIYRWTFYFVPPVFQYKLINTMHSVYSVALLKS